MIPPVTRNVLCLDVLAPSQGEQRARAAEAAHLAAQRELAKLRGGMESVDSEKDEAASRELALREECDKMKVIKREAWDAMVWLALPCITPVTDALCLPQCYLPRCCRVLLTVTVSMPPRRHATI